MMLKGFKNTLVCILGAAAFLMTVAGTQRAMAEDISADGGPVLGLVYLTQSLPVYDSRFPERNEIGYLTSGESLLILDVPEEDEEPLLYVSSSENEGLTGYVDMRYVVSSDERFVSWKAETDFGSNELLGADPNADINMFPESYREGLLAVRSSHPNWIFVSKNITPEWNEVVEAEMFGQRSLVSASKPSEWKKAKYSSEWYTASEKAVKYCLDPRNYLTENYIFAMEQLTYNPSYHSQEGVRKLLENTFMNGDIPNEGMTYAQAFFEIGATLKVSPYHLAGRVYQEQGSGRSPLISGTYPGYEGYYNYYNVQASGSTNTEIYTKGLTYAKNHGWSSRYLALKGGAEFISKNYILKGQDTLYLQKFDVDDTNGFYAHQYMQNITAPYTESQKTYKGYKTANALDNTFVFKIPVYRGMPESRCQDPSSQEPDPTPKPTLTPKPTPTPMICPFTDVPKEQSNWKHDAVMKVYQKGLMSGVTDTLFKPDDSITRGQVVTILHRMASSPKVLWRDTFPDVPDGKYYSVPVVWASIKGVAGGMTDGTFKPNMCITREQLARMLMEFANIKHADTSGRANLSKFSDIDKIGGWAIEYLQWAVDAGIISGKSRNGILYLDPKGEATRAECASMIYRLAEYYKW